MPYNGLYILHAWQKAENNDADSSYKPLHLILAEHPCLEQKKRDNYSSFR